MRTNVSIFTPLIAVFAVVASVQAENRLYLPQNIYLENERISIGKHIGTIGQWATSLTDGSGHYESSPSNGLKVVKWEYAENQNVATWTDLGQSGTNIIWTYKSNMAHIYLRPWLEWLHYSLSYNANGGSGSMSGEADIRYDKKVPLPKCKFTKTGYSFAGWSLSKSGGMVWSTGKSCDGHDFGVDVQNHDYGKDAKGAPVTLFAQWTPNQYTVTFDANCTGGSSDPANKKVTYDSTYGELPPPMRPGKAGRMQNESWRFDGWYDSSSNEVKSTTKVSVTNDVSLYAHWTEKFEVRYVDAAKFGGSLLKTEYVVSGGTATPPNNPEKTGYTFQKWTGYNDFLNVRQDRTYTAEYTGNGYKVVFHSGLVPDETHSQDFTYGESKALSPNTFVNEGFGFLGWAETAGSRTVKYADGDSVPDLATGGEVHLYAVWDANAYRIVFAGNGGTGTMDPIDMLYGMVTNLPPNAFVFDELEFKSWRDDLNKTNYLDGATVSNLTTKAGGTVTLKAIWYEGYFVEFNPCGGTGEMPRTAFSCGVESPLPANRFTKTGYTFDHWTNTQGKVFADGASVRDLAPQGATAALYAVWTPNTYTIRFDDNGANWGTMAIQTNTYDKAANLLPNNYEGNFKTFLGWARTPDAAAKEYDDKASVHNLTDEPNGTVVLYAVWKSTLSDLSQAAGCDNLNIQPGKGSRNISQEVVGFVADTTFGYKDHSSCRGTGARVGMFTTNSIAGTLMFRVKMTSSDCTLYLDKITKDGQVAETGFDVKKEEEDDQGWSLWKVCVDDPSEDKDWNGEVMWYVRDWSEDGSVWIDDIVWEPDCMTLHFDANGGTGAPEDLKIPLGGKDKLPRGVPTRAGFAFKGWKTDGDEKLYQPRDDFKKASAEKDDVITFLAVWEEHDDPPTPPDPPEPVVTNAVPSAVGGLVYNGCAQTGVVAAVGFTLTGNVATNAGAYTAVATVTNGVWEGGATGATNIAWTIAKATVDMSGVTFASATYEFDGEEHSIAVAGVPDGVEVVYTGDATNRTEVGTNTVTASFRVLDELNYNAITKQLTATLAITAKEYPPGPTPEPVVVTNAVPTAVTGLVYDGTAKTGVAAGANYTIVGNVATNAGGYAAVATVTNGVWEGGATGATNIAWTIAKATVDMSGVTFASATYEWDGEEHSIAVHGVPSGVEVVYTGDATNRTEVGTNTVTASFRVLDELNYNAIATQLTATLAIVDPPDPAVAYENIYFKATLAELGAEAVPTNRKITIKAEGLPKGLKLVTTALKDAKNKATGYYAYTVVGVPTEKMDGLSRMAYVRVTDNKVQTLYALDLSVLRAKVYEDKSFPDGEVKSEYANFSVTNLWPDVAKNPKNWTFSGWPAGIKYATKDTKDARAHEAYGKPTKAGRFTVKAVEKIAGMSYKSTHVATFTVWPEGRVGKEWTDQAYVGVYRESDESVKSASGLPTGVKFTAKDIVSKKVVTTEAHHFYGKPTKAGAYAVTLTHVDKSKTQFLWTITPADAPSFELQLTETAVDPETAKATIRQGVGYNWAIDATAGATVAASGLPTGLKLVKTAIKSGTKTVGYDYSVAGVPTKAGEFFVTFTTKLNGVSTVTTAAFTVLDLPAWAQGTFDGGADETFAAGGQVTFTVSKVGKLSGKWLSEGTTWTLSAASYDRYDEATASYIAQAIGKAGSGKSARVFTNEVSVAADAVGGVATSDLFLAYQNNWKVEPWKTVGKKVAKAPVLEFHPYADADDDHTNDVISLKFAASGKVTVKASYFKSRSTKTGKISWTTVSGSAVLCPQALPEETGAFPAVVFVYFPPKKGTPTAGAAYAVCVRLRWNGAAFDEWTDLE